MMFAAPPAVPAGPAGGVRVRAPVGGALLIVLGVLLVLATLVRRARTWSARGPKHLEVLADVPLGAKERAVLLRVGGLQLLLGVAPGRVGWLRVLPQPLEIGR